MLNNCEAKGLGCVLTLPIYRGREQHGNGREAGDKGTGSGRVRYGRREVLTPLSPPHDIGRNSYFAGMDQRTGSGVWWELWVFCCTNSDPLEI